MEVTPAQKKLLQHIATCIDKTGCQPSYRDICRCFGWQSTNAPASYINSLEKKGVVVKHGSRAIEFNWRQYLED